MGNQSRPPTAPRDQSEHGRCNLSNGLAPSPSIRPEQAGIAIPEDPECRGVEDGLNLDIESKVKVPPWPGAVRGLKPEPTGAEGDTGALQIPYTEPTKLQGPANFPPADQAASARGFTFAMPEEIAHDAVYLLKDSGSKSHGHEQVCWHHRGHVPDQGQSPISRKEEGPPSGELASHTLDQRHKHCRGDFLV